VNRSLEERSLVFKERGKGRSHDRWLQEEKEGDLWKTIGLSGGLRTAIYSVRRKGNWDHYLERATINTTH